MPLKAAVFEAVFANADWADRRDPTTHGQLSAQVDQHSVPMVTGAIPIIAVVAGAAGILFVTAHRHQDPPAPA